MTKCGWALAAALLIGPAHGWAKSRTLLQGEHAPDPGGATGVPPSMYNGGIPDGIARLRGQFYYVKDGRATLLKGEQRFSEGITLRNDSQVMLKDGRLLRLREGQMVTLGGELRDAPRRIELPKPLPANGLGN